MAFLDDIIGRFMQARTPVQLAQRFGISPQGERRDAGEKNIFVFKRDPETGQDVRLRRPRSQPLGFGEFIPTEGRTVQEAFQPFQEPGLEQPRVAGFTDFLGGDAQAAPQQLPVTPQRVPTVGPRPAQPEMLKQLPQRQQQAAQDLGLSSSEADLFNKESGINPLAQNPTTTAFGLWQGLIATRRDQGRKVGVDPNTRDPQQQLLMARNYIRENYRTADNALAFWNATKNKDASIAPPHLQAKARFWINENHVGY